MLIHNCDNRSWHEQRSRKHLNQDVKGDATGVPSRFKSVTTMYAIAVLTVVMQEPVDCIPSVYGLPKIWLDVIRRRLNFIRVIIPAVAIVDSIMPAVAGCRENKPSHLKEQE